MPVFDLFISVVILAAGIFIALVIGREIEKLSYTYSRLASRVVQVIIVVATILTTLEYMGIHATAFLELFRAVLYTAGLTIAIALGIAIGFSIKDEMKKFLFAKKRPARKKN